MAGRKEALQEGGFGASEKTMRIRTRPRRQPGILPGIGLPFEGEEDVDEQLSDPVWWS